MILQLANYRYADHPANHELNMAFWRAIRARIGPLHVVGRGEVSTIKTSDVDAITFTVFPVGTGTLGFLRSLSKWLNTLPAPGLVWCSDAVVTPLIAGQYAARHRRPWFLELQGNYFDRRPDQSMKTWMARTLALRAARLADRVRVCTEAHARSLERRGVMREKIDLIPTRVDCSLFDPLGYTRSIERRRLGVENSGAVVLVGVGNLIQGKGFQHAIEALTLLPLNTRLVLVGDGPKRAQLAKLAARLQVAHRVTFLGRKPHREVPGILAASDIFVLPSYSEGMPRAVNEAQAMSLPVVATALDGMMEQIIEGETGALCRPASSVDLARAIEPLVDDAALRIRMGTKARINVCARSSFDRVMNLWESALVRCMRS